MADAGPCGAPRSRRVDVDELWRDLKARTAVGRRGARASSSSSPDEEEEARPPPPPPPCRLIAATTTTTTTATTLNELLERASQAPTSRERLTALETLAAALGEQGWVSWWSAGARPLDGGLGGAPASSSSSSSRKALEVGKALVRRAVEDPSQAVRERAADLLAEMMTTRRTAKAAAAAPPVEEDEDKDDASPAPPSSSPSPPPDRKTTTTTAAPSSCPVLRIQRLTDAQARDLLPYALPLLAARLLAERPRRGAFARPTTATGDDAAAAAATATAPSSHEPCEEVRLALMRAFTAAVQRAGNAAQSPSPSPALARHAPLALALARRSASLKPQHKNGPALHLAACELCSALERSFGSCLQPLAMPLARALVPLTTGSRRAAVRAAAVRALAPLAHRGAHEAALLLVGWRDPHLVPIRELAAKATGGGGGDDDDDDDEEEEEGALTTPTTNLCGRLAADPSPAVRLAFVEALLRDWLTRLPGRRDHEARLVPFVLGGMVPYFPGEIDVEVSVAAAEGGGNSDSGAVAAAALLLLEDLGAQHERDLAHQGTLYEDDEDDDDDDDTMGLVAYAGNAPSTTPALALLPGPFSRRPSRGARLLVQAVLGGMVGAACAELSEAWQPSVRWRAAALMAVTLVVAENGADRHLPTLVPALCKALAAVDGGGNGNDNDAEALAALRWSRRCCEVLGVFCDEEVLWSLLQPLCAQGQAAAVRVLALVVRGARAARAAAGGRSSPPPPLLAQRALEMLGDELKNVQDVALLGAVRELEREVSR
jgi:hypothetical protein